MGEWGGTRLVPSQKKHVNDESESQRHPTEKKKADFPLSNACLSLNEEIISSTLPSQFNTFFMLECFLIECHKTTLNIQSRLPIKRDENPLETNENLKVLNLNCAKCGKMRVIKFSIGF